MDALSASVCLDRLLAIIHHHAPDAHSATELGQRLGAWLPYYRGLRLVLEGNILVGPADRATFFFLFAQALLDGIAETVRCYFSLPWSRATFSHWRLTQVFPRLCALYHLTGAMPEIYTQMCALQRQIVERPTDGATEGGLPIALERLHALMTQIEQYLVALLTCMERQVVQGCVPLQGAGQGGTDQAGQEHAQGVAMSSTRGASASIPDQSPALAPSSPETVPHSP